MAGHDLPKGHRRRGIEPDGDALPDVFLPHPPASAFLAAAVGRDEADDFAALIAEMCAFYRRIGYPENFVLRDGYPFALF
jgi:hypothetical protein